MKIWWGYDKPQLFSRKVLKEKMKNKNKNRESLDLGMNNERDSKLEMENIETILHKEQAGDDHLLCTGTIYIYITL